MGEVISFDGEKVSRYIEKAFGLYLGDPADSDYQRGYLAALIDLYREGLGKGGGDARLALLESQLSQDDQA